MSRQKDLCGNHLDASGSRICGQSVGHHGECGASPKPPVPDDLALMCGDDNSVHPGTGRLPKATTPKPPVPSEKRYGAREEKRLVTPADPGRTLAELLELFDGPDELVHQLASDLIAGRTRIAELELAQYSAHQRGQTVAAQEKRIAELEAHVASLTEENDRLMAHREGQVVEKALLELPELQQAVDHWKAMYRDANFDRVKADQRVTELEAEVAELRVKLKREKDLCNALAYMNPTHPARRTPELTEQVADKLLEMMHVGGPSVMRARLFASDVLDLVFGKEGE